MAKKGKSLGGYINYSFKDHDPVLDAFDRLLEIANDGREDPITPKKLEGLTGVRAGTFYRWRSRKTKRPQFAPMKAAVRAVGGKLAITYRGKILEGK